MKLILHGLAGLLFARLMYHMVITVHYLDSRKDLKTLNGEVISFNECGLYIGDRFTLILLYRFL